MKHIYTTIPIQVILLILLAFLLSSNNTYEVTGTLVDENDAPIVDHKVMLVDQNDEQIASDHTGSDGQFTLSYQVEPTSAEPGFGTDSPSEFRLGSSYPNPFNPRTRIPFQVPENTRAYIAVYNILGQRIMHTHAEVNKGTHEIEVNLGTGLSQGQYVLRVQGDGFMLTETMTFLSAGISSGTHGITVRSAGQVQSRASGSMHLADTEIYRIVVDDTDDYSGMEIEITANQDYELEVLKLSRKVRPPSLTTQEVSNITLTTARAGGAISDDGGSDVTEMGVVWAATDDPTLTTNDGMTADTLDNGAFSSRITGLSPETNYFMRAYATNRTGTSYGESFEFRTPKVEEIEVAVQKTVEELIPENYLPAVFAYYESLEEAKRAEYLDSLDQAGNTLHEIASEYFSSAEFKEEFEKSQAKILGKKNSDLDSQFFSGCSNMARLGYSRGLTIDANVSATGVVLIGVGLSAHGGGGAEMVYDFVNMDRNLYLFQMCGIGASISGGAGLGASTGISLGGFNKIITNIPANQQDTIDRFAGLSRGSSLSLGGKVAVLFGVDLSLGFGITKGVEGTPPGGVIENLKECPSIILNPQINRGPMALSFEASIGASVGTEAAAMLKGEGQRVATFSRSEDYFYTDFGRENKDDRVAPSLRMAADILKPSPYNGLTGGTIPSPLDLAMSAMAVSYGLFNPLECEEPTYPPLVITNSVEHISHNSAEIEGYFKDDGGDAVTERGICWSETNDPDIFTNCTSEGTGMGEFSSTIDDLQSDTRYYARAFAGNSIGTAYGDRISFSTLKEPPEPGTYSLNLTVSPSGSGSVSGAGEYEEGTTVTISATANSGYSFVNWSGDTDHVADENVASTTVTMPASDISLTANFEQDGGNGDGPRDTETEVVEVTNPETGRVWMDRNLGASRAATSSTDSQAYGDLYQWGRGADGHQLRNSSTTSTLSESDQPGHGSFITNNSGANWDWRSPQNDNLWQGVNGINNPCPAGYRLPTEAEWNAEINSWSSNNASGALNSPLKLPLAGYRTHSTGSLFLVGSYGLYWSSSVSGSRARYLSFNSSTADVSSGSRASGRSVRCTKD
ncbi:InlB B-repeat-containing protein [Natronogracilivirga saccharolytica]|uniref:T9SS type A sorting domain-containing protein n=1 Tax=Natronogracilivirga saccharolytica TaxID=2812953 RepID=A0A8J7UV25_9BACT|nr:FISUMP domain-containing protein [Natronogracilivirga saccharolytica]MBP3192980.1 T9SS type A sorting domain-containing protein [Natronogracilivirga saccharolytica]